MTYPFRLQDESVEFYPKFAEEASFESEDEETETQILEIAPPATPASKAPLPLFPPETLSRSPRLLRQEAIGRFEPGTSMDG
jgi:hypothetical protein